MGDRLLIVESPSKVKTLKSYLGPGWIVEASVGHVRDLPENPEDGIGVNPPSFKPQYEATKKGAPILAKLRKLAKEASRVYLATDPDREGEAIAWHLKEALRLGNNYQRVTFNEITKKAVEAAVANPRKIDDALVEAQETRRVVDRIAGYLASPVLKNQTGIWSASAGRVQSPANLMLVLRERAIRNFVSQIHYRVELTLPGAAGPWKATWKFGDWLPDGQGDLWLDRSMAERVAQTQRVRVLSLENTVSKSAPPPPFTTDSLLQIASSKLGFSPEDTMQAAQNLFAAGLITYHRTDSPNLSEDGEVAIRELIKAGGLPLSPEPRRWKAAADAQQGHEAIRPSEIKDKGESLSDKSGNKLGLEEHKVYKLIRDRAIASQIADAEYDVRTAQLESLDEINGRKPVFEARGRVLMVKGWLAYCRDDEADDEAAPEPDVPALTPNQEIVATTGDLIQSKTQPLKRYTEATLIGEMKRMGIGRPSTYAAITKRIKANGTAKMEQIGKKKYIVPTDTCETIVDALAGKESFIKFDYTKNLEEQLDAIASKKGTYLEVVRSFYNQLSQDLGQVEARRAAPVEAKPKAEAAEGVACPLCGGAMLKRAGKFGPFYGCSGYPKCKGIINIPK